MMQRFLIPTFYPFFAKWIQNAGQIFEIIIQMLFHKQR